MSQNKSPEASAWELYLTSLSEGGKSDFQGEDNQQENIEREIRETLQRDPRGFILKNPEYFFDQQQDLHKEAFLALISNEENEDFLFRYIDRFNNLDKEVAFAFIRAFPGKAESYVFKYPEHFLGFTFGREFANVLLESGNPFWMSLIIKNIQLFEDFDEGFLTHLAPYLDLHDKKTLRYILQNGQKFGGLHTEFLLRLCLLSDSKQLANEFIQKFSDIDIDLALSMTPEQVFAHPQIFSESPFQKGFALSVIRSKPNLLRIHFDRFTGLDKEVALEMMVNGLASIVTANGGSFEDLVFDKDTALQLSSKTLKQRIKAQDLDQFHDLDFQVARVWLRTYFADYVIKNPDRFLHGQKVSGRIALEMLESTCSEEAEFILANHTLVEGGIVFDKKFLQHFSQFPSFVEAFLENYEQNISQFRDFDTESAKILFEGLLKLQGKEKAQNKIRGDLKPKAYNILVYFDNLKKFDLDIETAQILCNMEMGQNILVRIDLFPELEALRTSLRDETKNIFDWMLLQNRVPLFKQEDYDYFTKKHKEELEESENHGGNDELTEGDKSEYSFFDMILVVCLQIKKNLEAHKFSASAEVVYALLKKYSPNIENINTLLNLGYTGDQIREYDWVLNNTTALGVPESDKFPCEARATAQSAWILKHAFYLPEGWEMKRLGKILYNRLHARVDTSIHDVTYFLKEFETPDKKDDVVYKSLQTEVDLLFALMETPETLRTRLPAKKNRYEELFAYQASEMVYEVLLPLAQKGPVSLETLKQEVHEVMSHYQEQPHLPKQKDRKTLLEEVQVVLLMIKDQISLKAEEKKSIPELIQELRHIGLDRAKYVNNVTAWFEDNQSTPRTLLTYAFANRPLALANGCRDNPRAIKQWADFNGLRLTFEKLEREGTLPDNISIEDLQKYKSWFDELIRCYSGENVIYTLSRLKREFHPEFSIPPFRRELGDGFVGEILHKNDPRGFTIGYDTGCCMTLGGASESCIHAGYAHKDFGFFALYKDGVLCAQSLLYTNPDSAHILVCDNIEANQGRDKKFILKKYQTFFREYCKEKNPFERVHVGVGYTEVGLSDLDEVDAIQMSKVSGEYIYTDAENQKLLCTADSFEKKMVRKMNEKYNEEETEVSEEEKLQELEKAIPILHAEAKEFFTLLRPEELPKIIEIARATFGSDSFRVDEELLKEKIEDPHGFPQLISAREEANEIPIGYFFARETGQDSIESQYRKSSGEDLNYPLILVTDIVLVPEYQKRGIGTNILLHILKESRTRAGFRYLDVGISLENEMMVQVVKRNEKKITEAGWHIKSFKDGKVEGQRYIIFGQNSFFEGKKYARELTEDDDGGLNPGDDDGWGDDFDG